MTLTCTITGKEQVNGVIFITIIVKDDEDNVVLDRADMEMSTDFCDSDSDIEEMLADQLELGELVFVWG